MSLPRTVTSEALDHLAPAEPAAVRARRDLRRVHRAMGTRSILLRALRSASPAQATPVPLRVLELGAGDGTLMLGVARALAPKWPHVELALLDRQMLVSQATLDAFSRAGWSAAPVTADVLDWAGAGVDAPARCAPQRWDLIVANLFVHHFAGEQLARLLAAVADRTERFLACEPRRSWLALAGSHLVGVLGANAVTRADAVLSVHAGFRASELSALWPAPAGAWRLREYPAGLFSHCFCAVRIPSG